MGRVSRYKKVKRIDPFAKNGSWKSDVGDCATLRRGKRKSKTALKLKEAKRNKLQKRGKKGDDRRGGGSNGFGDVDGYDLPPEGGDDFDLKDLMGSVKRQRPKAKNTLLLDAATAALPTVRSSSSHHKSAGNTDGDKKQSAKKKQKFGADKAAKAKAKYDGTSNTNITHKTPTSEIIAAHAEGRSTKNATSNDAASAVYGASKQEKRRAFLEKKKGRKRKRGSGADDDDDGYEAEQQALQSLHSQSASKEQKQAKQPKKHLVKQTNYSDTMIARTAIDEQVERPPTFTSLPRGAHKLAKNKKAKRATDGALKDEDEDEKQRRVKKEQMEMEAMRQRVMRQYAALRESRRSGGR